jgi:hypothetical protein
MNRHDAKKGFFQGESSRISPRNIEDGRLKLDAARSGPSK